MKRSYRLRRISSITEVLQISLSAKIITTTCFGKLLLNYMFSIAPNNLLTFLDKLKTEKKYCFRNYSAAESHLYQDFVMIFVKRQKIMTKSNEYDLYDPGYKDDVPTALKAPFVCLSSYLTSILLNILV